MMCSLQGCVSAPLHSTGEAGGLQDSYSFVGVPTGHPPVSVSVPPPPLSLSLSPSRCLSCNRNVPVVLYATDEPLFFVSYAARVCLHTGDRFGAFSSSEQ